jgi:hypothetical protein
MPFGQLRIEQMYAFVVVDDDGTEGVIGVPKPGGEWIPLVGADMRRVEQMTPIAKQLASAIGKSIDVLKFSQRTLLKTIKPGKPPLKKATVPLAEKVQEAVGRSEQIPMQVWKEPELRPVTSMSGVVVHPTLANGVPGVAIVFLDEDGKELPAIGVSGTQAKDLGPLCAAAFDMAMKSQN